MPVHLLLQCIHLRLRRWLPRPKLLRRSPPPSASAALVMSSAARRAVRFILCIVEADPKQQKQRAGICMQAAAGCRIFFQVLY
ncbi:hypothetical protein CFC21_069088 [Triticum aestivum]|uniref:Uncharacterized protein n=3 Tax=Triticum TaxID=4564 RepID=A0A9R0WVW1_TRITD|nr:hypothetical protein CFC21_069088 [Triticum aestivum]VAI25386.1 unnamed protein product [Triticum turgidum subsp. durum]